MTPESGVKGWQVDSALVMVALIWGATFVLVKQALNDISTLLFLTLRFAFASVSLFLIFGGKVRQNAEIYNLRQTVVGGMVAGACLFSGYVLQTFGLKYTSAAKAGFLTGLYIPLVPLIGAAVYRRFPRMPELAGVSCAFAGMALLTVQDTLLSIGLGDLLVMACAVAYAFHIMVLGHLAPRTNTTVLNLAQITMCAILGGLTFWWTEPVRVAWTADVWIALAVTSLLATALAFAIQTWAQKYSSPTRTALIFSMEPVFAWVTSYLVAGEVFRGRSVAGAVLILAGILLVELKPAVRKAA